MTTSLDQYGTPNGFQLWTLDDELSEVSEDVIQRMLSRARTILHVYGPYDSNKEGFQTLITEMVYYTAEALYFWGGMVRSIVSPMRAERIGSYSYDKGDRKSANKIIEGHDIVWPLILHLRDNSGPMRYGIIVEQLNPVNLETGLRSISDSYTNRTARAIKKLGLVSDTDEFNNLVYGDGAWWPL